VRFLPLLACLPALLAAQDAREIMRRSVDLDQKNEEIARNYTFLERQEQRERDSAGKVKDSDIRTWDVTLLEGSPYRRLVAHNDQPLPLKEQQKEQEKLQKSIEQRHKETDEQRQSRVAEWERRRKRQRQQFLEVVDAFDFRLVGEEALNGAEAYVIDATPRPGYKAKSLTTAYFRKIKARFWIDKRDYQWVKVDAETLDTISFGGFLLRMGKGGRLSLEQAHINNEVWLPKRIEFKGTVRIALIKVLRGEMIMTFSDYKKFSAESRVVPH